MIQEKMVQRKLTKQREGCLLSVATHDHDSQKDTVLTGELDLQNNLPGGELNSKKRLCSFFH